MSPVFPEPAPAGEAEAAASGARSPARRCRLSVLFCDLGDSTALGGRLEAEEYADLLAALRQSCHAAVDRHGGTVLRIQGEGMLAVFGHPLPHEDDGRRAVETALQLHEAVRGFATPRSAGLHQGLALRSGIHAGTVLVQGGDVDIGRLELLGMVPNIAARLSAAAGRDEVLVSEEVLGPARASFETGALRQVPVQGHDLPVACWPIVGRAALDSSPESPLESR